ncbi:hypothetical protein RHMOL_Rhmol04G0347100 [Rhododendron molle]|uniref:Uncharacterized protein n=1 Tax=Rhododendron molle TaxID=49168 RepID=A0ACC0P941_RHOML|nr:hypothetical protein RHMOL_Rhmol04G0347100 [Rhododendron molle]
MDPPPQHPSAEPSLSSMETTPTPFSHLPAQPDLTSSPSPSPWDWSDFLDFGLELDPFDHFNLDQSQTEPQLPPPLIAPDPDHDLDRVRKRDPRLTCPNYIARVPCACPELDEEKAEEEEGLPGKKRVRAADKGVKAVDRAMGARCQVPVCGADIGELKGYHKRHRVCLRCANASAVVLEGVRKRYCQQCGKFHILSDFDEGKRSCRRKLERHNNRRRRKPCESRVAGEREPHGLVLADDEACENENGKESICLSNQIAEREPLLESEEGRISTLCSNPGSENNQNDSGGSFVASGEAQIVGEKDESKYARSSSYCDDKSAYSSMVCPMDAFCHAPPVGSHSSFMIGILQSSPDDSGTKYLQHCYYSLIFQWLASMPVELEGYIRPGCTILTVFIAMPNFMWVKLLEDPVVYIQNFVAAPGKMLPGRGNIFVYIDNVLFRAVRDGTSVLNVKVEERAPKLHYVRPSCFEAGKPMEFVACGSNLLQPKFRFLVSFAGKYLRCDYCVPSMCGDSEGVTASSDHQLLKIYVPHSEPDLYGPAFIEVENESGLSNFIPIVIGTKEICSEMKIMEHRFESSTSSTHECEVSVRRQPAFSQFVIDTAWLLRKPALEDLEHILALSQIGRFNRLLTFLIDNKSTSILERVLHYITILMDHTKLNKLAYGIGDSDMELLQGNLEHARDILCQRLQPNGDSVLHSGFVVQKGDSLCRSSQADMLSITCSDQEMEATERGNLDARAGSNSEDQSLSLPLLSREVVMRMNLIKERPRMSCSRVFTTNKYLASHRLVFVIAVAAACFGICAVVFHPQKVGHFATTIRRCLFDNK